MRVGFPVRLELGNLRLPDDGTGRDDLVLSTESGQRGGDLLHQLGAMTN